MNIDEQTIKEIITKAKNFLQYGTDKSLSVGANSEHFFYTASDGKVYVVLLPKNENVVKDYEKQAVLLPFLERLNLPVLIPNGIMIIKEDNFICAIEEKMHGTEWNYTTYANFAEHQKKAFSKQIANFFFQLHQTPTDNLPACSFDDFFVFPDKETLSQKLSYVFIDEIKEDSKFIDKIYDRAKIIFNFGCDDKVFMHRDFHPQNTFVDKSGNLCGIIDWAACCIAPRIREFQNLAGTDDKQLLVNVLNEYNDLAGSHILPEQVVLFNHIEWITCLDILKDRPSLFNWAKKDGTLLATGKLDEQIKKYACP